MLPFGIRWYWHLWTHSNGWDANMLVKWSHWCPWKAILVFQDFSRHSRFVMGNGSMICFQFPSLVRVLTTTNSFITTIIGILFPFSLNLNFSCNFIDLEIEDLEGLSLSCMHLWPFVLEVRTWSLYFSSLFTVIFVFNLVQPMSSYSFSSNQIHMKL